MNNMMIMLGGSIEDCLMKCLPKEYLERVFSEDMGLDDLVDQVILELIKYAYESKLERHPLNYYLGQSGDIKDDLRMTYSRLIKISNDYRNKELDILEKYYGINTEDARPPKMQEMNEKLDGYQLTEMDYQAITDIGELRLIKAIINHRLCSAKKISNTEFIKIAQQYDKRVISHKEKSQYSDEQMVSNSLSYFILEWRYAFDFIYQCASLMQEYNIDTPEEMFAKVQDLLGFQSTYSILGIYSASASRMVGFREKLIRMSIEDRTFLARYKELLAVLDMVKSQFNINGVSIKKWFLDNTDVHDWASFLEEYDIFRCVSDKKDYSNQTIRNMRGLIGLIFPDDYDKTESDRNGNTEVPFDDILQDDGRHNAEGDSVPKLACYIEEYRNDEGALCARLREKESNKRVVVLGNEYVKFHMLRFMSAAKKHIDIMPTVYNREGTDIVAVRGLIIKEEDDMIEVNIAVPGAGYLFE
ncbi:MAG: hypothetical protein K6E47_17255 [Lachnospiraceae bacterium]|nr:hypothetical protein [Lachnospiraceae bacterium]